MNILILFFLFGLGYVLGMRDTKKAIKNYFTSIGYTKDESQDMAKKIIETNGEIE